VLANDEDPDGTLDAATVEAVDAASHGDTSVDAAGRITYDPDIDYVGSDTFSYQVCDTEAACATATVSVGISGAPGGLPDTSTITAVLRRSAPFMWIVVPILLGLAVLAYGLSATLVGRHRLRRSDRPD
jgi:hypothetical protein